MASLCVGDRVLVRWNHATHPAIVKSVGEKRVHVRWVDRKWRSLHESDHVSKKDVRPSGTARPRRGAAEDYDSSDEEEDDAESSDSDDVSQESNDDSSEWVDSSKDKTSAKRTLRARVAVDLAEDDEEAASEDDEEVSDEEPIKKMPRLVARVARKSARAVDLTEEEEEDMFQARVATADPLPFGPGKWQGSRAASSTTTTCLCDMMITFGAGPNGRRYRNRPATFEYMFKTNGEFVTYARKVVRGLKPAGPEAVHTSQLYLNYCAQEDAKAVRSRR